MSGKPIDDVVAGEDDALTLADVAVVLGEIAEGFDGGEYAVSDETRRVLIDFANGLPEHPLFNIVGHYFAQHQGQAEFRVGVDVTGDAVHVTVLRCEGDVGVVIYSETHPLRPPSVPDRRGNSDLPTG